jgi:hypothetical protein
VDFDWKFKKNLTLHLTAGYERAKNLFFTQGNDRNNYLAAVSLRVDLDRHFGFEAN